MTRPRKLRPVPALALLAMLAGFTGLTLLRLWAVLGARLSGWLLLPIALLLAAACTVLVRRFRLAERFCLPWGRSWKTAALAAAAFLLGAFFDASPAMFPLEGMLAPTLPLRLLSGLGSGIVFAAVVLALVKAARDWGRLECPCGRLMLVLALAVNIATAVYSAGSATIYSWDAATYWDLSAALAEQPLSLDQLRQVLESVATQDYNSLLAFPISLVMRLLGTGRYVYLLSSVNLYVLPALWGLCVLGKRLRHGGLLLALLTPMLLYTALVGFVDVAAAGLGIWTFVVYTQTDRPAAARGILAGAMLVGTFLLRRYFFFFAVSFGAAALAANLAFRRRAWADFAALFCSAGVCSLFFAQSFLVEKVLSVRYGDLYSAYAQGRLVDVKMLCRYFGAVLLILALAAAVFLLLRRAERRWAALLALAQPLACYFLFSRVQSHGQQHLLLYLPAFAFLLCAGLEELPRRVPVRVCAWALAAGTALCTLVPRAQPSSPEEIAYPDPAPSFTYAPPQRADAAQLIALRAYVDSLSAQQPKTAAVVASSFVFNADIFCNAYRSLGIPQPDAPETSVIYMTQVDKRDSFSWNVLLADYLVVGDPVQTHLGEENQQVVALVANAVLSGEGLGTAYRPLEQTFALNGGVTVRVYERVRDVTAAEYRALSESLAARYPDYAQLYQPPAWTLEP